MGFLKFLLAIALLILGFLLVGGAFLSCINANIAAAPFNQNVSSVPYYIVGIIGFVIFLGGAYMLRKH